MKKRDVILYTDLGSDIDDTWALGLLLKSPELNLKLVITATGDTAYRAKLAKRQLKSAGRLDIPVAMGVMDAAGFQKWCPSTLQQFLEQEHDQTDVSGCPAAEPALLEVLKHCSGTPAIIAIGPLDDLGRIVAKHPEIAAKCDLIGMQGSVYKDYEMKPQRCKEYNVFYQIHGAQEVLDQAHWRSITITPLDTCGNIHLSRDQVLALENVDPVMHEVVSANIAYFNRETPGQRTFPPQSSCLFDTVAVYLAISEKLCKIEELNLRVDDQGMFADDPKTLSKWRCAVDWTSLEKYHQWLYERLAKPAPAL